MAGHSPTPISHWTLGSPDCFRQQPSLATTMANHPYYPLDLELSGYTDNTIGLVTLLLGFSAGASVILGTALFLSRRYHPSISGLDQFLVLWFVLCKFRERAGRDNAAGAASVANQPCMVLTFASRIQLARSTVSSKATSSSTTHTCLQCKTSSASCGRSTQSPIRGTWQPTRWS